jgi:putative transposase
MNRTTDLVTSALAQALATRRRSSSEFTARGLIHHSDAGSQYTALAFTEELAEAGIAGSIDTGRRRPGQRADGIHDRVFKTECIIPGARGKNWTGLRDVERETAEWARWYNTERIHSSIDYVTPIEREVVYSHTIAQRGEVA